MPAFDLAVGLSQTTCNAIAARIYRENRAALFAGQVADSDSGLEVSWTVTTPPQFELNFSRDAAQALFRNLQHQEPATTDKTMSTVAGIQLSDVIEALKSADPADLNLFLVRYVDVAVTSAPSGAHATTVSCDIDAVCQIYSAHGTVAMGCVRATATRTDPLSATIFDRFVLPAFASLTDNLVSGLTFPALSGGGLAFSPPAVGMRAKNLVAVARLRSNGGTAPPPPGPFPPDRDFLLLSHDAAAAATTKALAARLAPQTLNGGRHLKRKTAAGTASPVDIRWQADLEQKVRSISVDNTSLAIDFRLEGAGGCSIAVLEMCGGFGLSISGTFRASASISPAGSLHTVRVRIADLAFDAPDVQFQGVPAFLDPFAPGLRDEIGRRISDVSREITARLQEFHWPLTALPQFHVDVGTTCLSTTFDPDVPTSEDGVFVLAGTSVA